MDFFRWYCIAIAAIGSVLGLVFAVLSLDAAISSVRTVSDANFVDWALCAFSLAVWAFVLVVFLPKRGSDDSSDVHRMTSGAGAFKR